MRVELTDDSLRARVMIGERVVAVLDHIAIADMRAQVLRAESDMRHAWSEKLAWDEFAKARKRHSLAGAQGS